MKILGLDISTTCLGEAVLNFGKKNCKLAHIDHFNPPKKVWSDEEEDFIWTILQTKKHIKELIEKVKPDAVAVEDYIRFLKGGSTSKTTLKLAILNRNVCVGIRENFPDLPLYICNVLSIRSTIRKAANLEKMPDKTEVPQHLEKLLNLKFPPIYKKGKDQKMADQFFDRSDAVAVAYYSYQIM